MLSLQCVWARGAGQPRPGVSVSCQLSVSRHHWPFYFVLVFASLPTLHFEHDTQVFNSFTYFLRFALFNSSSFPL